MNASPDVERWFAEKTPPTEPTIRKVREVIMRADRRMTEFVKYGTLTFGYDGDCATFVQASNKKTGVADVPSRRADSRKFRSPGGDGPERARLVRLADLAEAQARSAELSKIVVSRRERAFRQLAVDWPASATLLLDRLDRWPGSMGARANLTREGKASHDESSFGDPSARRP